jgi:hypothetical protein
VPPAWQQPEPFRRSSWSGGRPPEQPGDPVPAKEEWSCCQPERWAEEPSVRSVPPPKEQVPSAAEAEPPEPPDAEPQPAEPSEHQDEAEPPEDAEPPGLARPPELLPQPRSRQQEPEA